jgi:hypothetical protein
MEQKEYSHGILTLTLSTPTVDRSARHPRIVEVIIDKVNLVPAVDKDQSADRRHADQKIIKGTHLLVVINPDKLNN